MITVSTRPYYRSHMKEPKGRGSWAFDIAGKIEWFNGTYTEARKAAVAKAKEVGAAFVAVLP